MNKSEIKDDTCFGVIGVCSFNGNLIARIINENGFKVIGSDMASKEDCKLIKNLEDSGIKVYYGSNPDEFFDSIDYVIPPISLSKDADIFKVINDKGVKVLELTEALNIFTPNKPVFGVTGTNGKTTIRTLLKKIAYDNGITPSEHGLDGMQGNAELIPALQARLNGDVAILEVGTFGVSGSIKKITEYTNFSHGLMTNITADHLTNGHEFLNYASVKGEFIEAMKNKTLIVNSNDPTIMGLIRDLNYEGNLITFGIDDLPVSLGDKQCVCGENIKVKEIIAGSGFYFCKNCGLTNPQSDYVATNIDLNNSTYDLFTPTGKLEVKMGMKGMHNVYNTVGAIIAAHEFLELSYDSILKTVAEFTGAPGRMEKIANFNDKTIFVDYAHNPGGVETVLREFKKLYGDIATVITVSSESGADGDLDILNYALEFSKYVIPASFSSQKVAQNIESNKLIFPELIDSDSREGTVGASYDEVKNGVKVGLDCDCKVIVAIGEAATKFKSSIHDLI